MQCHWSFSLESCLKLGPFRAPRWPDTVDGYTRHTDGKYINAVRGQCDYSNGVLRSSPFYAPAVQGSAPWGRRYRS